MLSRAETTRLGIRRSGERYTATPQALRQWQGSGARTPSRRRPRPPRRRRAATCPRRGIS